VVRRALKASHVSGAALPAVGRAPESPPYLIKNILPQTKVAIIAGMWSAGKTFVAAELASCIMTGKPFAGSEVMRTGAILWLAAEGENEVEIRVKAALETVNEDDRPDPLPFARQALGVPKLTAPDAREQLFALVDQFAEGLKKRCPGVELAAIIVDTLNSAAHFEDQNSGSEAVKVMNLLREISDKTGALVVAIDHFGKMVETGVKGSSDKSNSADAILAVLSDQDMEGNHSNRRLAQKKLRNGPSGTVTPFQLRAVPVDSWGNTTCVVDWSVPAPTKTKPEKPAWSAKGRVLKSCMERVMDQAIEQQPFGVDGPKVRAMPLDKVRSEFVLSYAGDTPDAKRKAFKRALDEARDRNLVATREIGASLIDWVDAKRKAFKRALDEARDRNLVATREIGASLIDWVWFVKDNPPKPDTWPDTDSAL
jgi:uncharacterized membrane protein